MTATTSPSSVSQLSQQMLSHTAPHYTFSFTPFLQKTYQHSLPADRPICKAYASGHCPLKTRCPDRHAPPAPGKDGAHTTTSSSSPPFGSLVCKHWLRGLCKKGEGCEFLHEYNLRRMPECNFFVRNGYCSNGDECLYLHVDPASRLPPCPHYDRGFCPLGPRCAKRHVRRGLCAFYLAGFCPSGRACRDGAHPRWERDLEAPKVREERTAEEEERIKEERERERESMRERERERDGDRYDRQGGGRGDRFGGGGRGGRFRGRGGGGPRFRGRNH